MEQDGTEWNRIEQSGLEWNRVEHKDRMDVDGAECNIMIE